MTVASLHIFYSLSPGRLWICSLTCSVQTESRSLSMDTVSKLHTWTPMKETSSLQSLFVVSECPGGLARLCLQIQCNLRVVPAKHLPLGERLLCCRWVWRSVTTSVLWETERHRQNKGVQEGCNVKYNPEKCCYKQYIQAWLHFETFILIRCVKLTFWLRDTAKAHAKKC